MEDRPGRIKGYLFAFDDDITAAVVDQMLADLAAHRFLVRYTYLAEVEHQPREGRAIHLITFHKHQRPHHKEAVSAIPAPDGKDYKARGSASPRKGRSTNLSAAEPQPRSGSDRPLTLNPSPLTLNLDPVPKDQAVPSGRPPAAPEENPDQNLGVITKIAHEAIDLNGSADLGLLTDVVKDLCGSRGIDYGRTSTLVRKAVDSALAQRRRVS